LVYSTCSVLVEENEQIVQYALEKRKNVKIVNSGVEIGRDGFKSFRGKTFDEKMHFAKRIFVSFEWCRYTDWEEIERVTWVD
jgi:ribosomal RNA methyltransferase Nop2